MSEGIGIVVPEVTASTAPSVKIQGVSTITRSSSSTNLNLFVQIIGETGVGKTHLASQFPRPFLIDTSAKGDAEIVFKRIVKESSRYAHIKDFQELAGAVKEAGVRSDVSTIIIDTGSDLQKLAEPVYLKSVSKPGKERQSALQIEYGFIRDIIDAKVIFPICSNTGGSYGKNLVLTIQMKPQWKKVIDSSGNAAAIADGRQADKYERLDYGSDIKLYLHLEGDKMRKRYISVVKNRFKDAVGTDWIPEISATWDDIKKLVSLQEGERLLE